MPSRQGFMADRETGSCWHQPLVKQSLVFVVAALVVAAAACSSGDTRTRIGVESELASDEVARLTTTDGTWSWLIAGGVHGVLEMPAGTGRGTVAMIDPSTCSVLATADAPDGPYTIRFQGGIPAPEAIVFGEAPPPLVPPLLTQFTGCR